MESTVIVVLVIIASLLLLVLVLQLMQVLRKPKGRLDATVDCLRDSPLAQVGRR